MSLRRDYRGVYPLLAKRNQVYVGDGPLFLVHIPIGGASPAREEIIRERESSGLPIVAEMRGTSGRMSGISRQLLRFPNVYAVETK